MPAEVAAGLPPLPPNHFYFYPPDPLLEGAITAIEDSDPFDQYVYRLRRVLYQGRTRWQNVLIADTLQLRPRADARRRDPERRAMSRCTTSCWCSRPCSPTTSRATY
nr:hypothetical protein [Pseudomonas aeruginosa]